MQNFEAIVSLLQVVLRILNYDKLKIVQNLSTICLFLSLAKRS